MNREQALLNAVMVLGKNAEYFRNKGWREHAQENEQAVKELQASVAESRALDAVTSGTHIHKLIASAIAFLDARAAVERRR